jgi:hypothetical protein
MRTTIDVHVLLYASDTESPLLARALAFLEQCAQQGEVFCFASMPASPHTIGTSGDSRFST